MTPRQQRELQKQLLLLKGEALRMRVTLELEQWKRPLRLASFGTAWLPHLKTAFSLLTLALPDSRLNRLFKTGGKLAVLWPLWQRWWAKQGG